MSDTTIFAWTEPTPPEGFPAYVNLRRTGDGKHLLTVRSRGNAGRDVATVELSDEAVDGIFHALAQDCGDEGFHCGDPECDACVPPAAGVQERVASLSGNGNGGVDG